MPATPEMVAATASAAPGAVGTGDADLSRLIDQEAVQTGAHRLQALAKEEGYVLEWREAEQRAREMLTQVLG